MYNPYGSRKPRLPGDRAPEPATIMQDDHPALYRNLLRDLQTEKAKLVEELILAKDWPDFEKRRGLINGIDQAIFLCQEATKRLDA